MMVGEKVWQEQLKRRLKAELKRKSITYGALAARLTAMGSPESEANLANKISRGSFSAAFLLQCLNAMGCTNISVTVE